MFEVVAHVPPGEHRDEVGDGRVPEEILGDALELPVHELPLDGVSDGERGLSQTSRADGCDASVNSRNSAVSR